jgi:hypothetical protein
MLLQIAIGLIGLLLLIAMVAFFIAAAYELSGLGNQLIHSERAKPVIQFVRDALEAE